MEQIRTQPAVIAAKLDVAVLRMRGQLHRMLADVYDPPARMAAEQPSAYGRRRSSKK